MGAKQFTDVGRVRGLEMEAGKGKEGPEDMT